MATERARFLMPRTACARATGTSPSATTARSCSHLGPLPRSPAERRQPCTRRAGASHATPNSPHDAPSRRTHSPATRFLPLHQPRCWRATSRKRRGRGVRRRHPPPLPAPASTPSLRPAASPPPTWTGLRFSSTQPSAASVRAGASTTRNPLLLFVLPGVLLLRLAERQLVAVLLLFQLPPRITRFAPRGRRPDGTVPPSRAPTARGRRRRRLHAAARDAAACAARVAWACPSAARATRAPTCRETRGLAPCGPARRRASAPAAARRAGSPRSPAGRPPASPCRRRSTRSRPCSARRRRAAAAPA